MLFLGSLFESYCIMPANTILNFQGPVLPLLFPNCPAHHRPGSVKKLGIVVFVIVCVRGFAQNFQACCLMRVPCRPSRWRKVTSQTQLLRRNSSTIGFGWDSIMEAERVLQVDMVNPKKLETGLRTICAGIACATAYTLL